MGYVYVTHTSIDSGIPSASYHYMIVLPSYVQVQRSQGDEGGDEGGGGSDVSSNGDVQECDRIWAHDERASQRSKEQNELADGSQANAILQVHDL